MTYLTVGFMFGFFVFSLLMYIRMLVECSKMADVIDSHESMLKEHRESLLSIKSVISQQVEKYVNTYSISQKEMKEFVEKLETIEDSFLTDETAQTMIDKEVSKEVQRYMEEEYMTDHEERIDSLESKVDKICSAIRCLGNDLDES